MPQPLSKVLPGTGWNIGNLATLPGEHRPKLAAMAMDVIASWAVLENSFSAILISMLGANPTPAIAMFTALNSNASQQAALRAAAEATLSGEEMDAFEAILGIFSKIGRQRNKIAHHLWGYRHELPDALLLCSPQDVSANTVRAYTKTKGKKLGPEQVYVYTERDFTALRQDISRAMELLGMFHMILVRNSPLNKGDAQLQKLCSEPEIRSYVDRKRARQKNIQQAPE